MIGLNGIDRSASWYYADTINRICSDQYLEYLKHPGDNEKPFSQVKRELRKILRQNNTTTDITLKGVRMGKIVSK